MPGRYAGGTINSGDCSRLRVGLGGQSVLVYVRAREHTVVTADAERTWSLLRLLAQNPALHAIRLQVSL